MRPATPRALAAALVLALVASAAGEQGHLGGAHGGGSRLPARRFGADASGARHAGAADAGGSGGARGIGRPVPIVLPSATDPTKLTLRQEGLDALRALRGPVAPVVVIGPYRSGKSFLLNQLLGVPCDEGFGVGHTRKTETKGVWMWSEPTVVMSSAPGKPPTSVVYVDTEGSFLAERCYAIATALLAHLQRTAERDENPLHRAALQKLGDVKALLGRIHVFRVHDAHEQLACVRQLDAFVRAWPYSRDGLTRVAAVDGRALGPADVGRLRLFKADKRGRGKALMDSLLDGDAKRSQVAAGDCRVPPATWWYAPPPASGATCIGSNRPRVDGKCQVSSGLGAPSRSSSAIVLID